MPEWWKKNSKNVPLHHENFQKIVSFFVYECPVQRKNGNKVTPRATTFEDRGIVDGKQVSLLNVLKQKIEHKECFQCCETDSDIINIEKAIHKKYPVENHTEFVLYIENKDLRKTRTVYYSIRNALAHGTFSYVEAKNGEIYYYLEAKKEDKIKARICIKEKTILKWVDITQRMMKTGYV